VIFSSGKTLAKVAKSLESVHFGLVMKIKAILICALMTAWAPLHAEFFADIKDDLTGPAVEGSPKYTALYFSAHWCPPCRMFTPKLVEWYNEFQKTHPDFELVFVSSDRDKASMEEYVKGDNMPWPVVKFDQAKDEKFTKYSSSGIPYLVLIDADGKNLTGQPGNQWESPQKVLQKIEELVPAAS